MPGKYYRLLDRWSMVFVLVWNVAVMVGCQAKPMAISTEVPQESALPALEPTATETLAPSPTPPPDVVILLAPQGADPSLLAQVQPVLEELSAQDGVVLQVRQELAQTDPLVGVRLVVALPPDAGISNLASAFPAVHFLALEIPGLQDASNLSHIGAGGARPDQQGFLAGYLAAVITPDWRVGVITPAGSPSGVAARLGFVNGVIFYCGLCRPSYPPFIQYPLFVEIAPNASSADQQAAADTLISNAVKTIYVAPGAGDDALLEYLAQRQVQIIGSGLPPQVAASQWIASIGLDWPHALRQAWAGWIAGQGSHSLNSPLGMSNVNEQLLSPGRQALVERMLDELLQGYIDTGVDPSTGQLK